MAASSEQNLSSILINLRPLAGNRDPFIFYRSSSPHNLEGQTITAFLNLGIRTIFDLRSPEEREKNPSKLIPYYSFVEYNDIGDSWTSVSSPEEGMEKGTVYLVSFFTKKYVQRLAQELNCSIDNGYEMMFEQGRRKNMADSYVDFLERDPSVIRAIMKVICEPSPEKVCPVLFHCSMGKDRTGVLSALINGQLGCSVEVIVEEYAKSETLLQPVMPIFKAIYNARGISDEMLRTSPITMKKVIDFLTERYGGITEYLKAYQMNTLF